MDSTPLQKPPRTVLDNQLSFKRLDTATELGRELIKWAALVVIAFMGYRCVNVLAGRSTLAEIGIKILGNIKVSDGIITLLTGSGWAYGLAQRSLRRRNIERVVPAKNELERMLDPNRSSSNLTGKGTTPAPKRKG
jgi:hypothetical protein